MEAISYVNIFETKGLEYLLVISFLLGFLLLVRYLSSQAPDGVEWEVLESEAGEGPSVTCAADFECPYRSCLSDILDGDGVLDDQGIVA